MSDYHQKMLQHVKACGLGFINDKPYPYGMLQYELTEKIKYDVNNFGDLLPEALVARDEALSRIQRGIHHSIGHNSGDADYGDDAGLGAEENLQTVAAKTARIAELAKLQVEREADVARLEGELATAVRNLEDVSKRELPRLLVDLNVAKLPLANGASVNLKKKLVASVLKDDQPEMIAWLVKRGFGALPKRKITVEFPMGAFRKAGLLLGYLRRHYKDMIVTDAESIHAGTLNAWAKETTEKNEAALRDGGKVLELPEILKLTDLLESAIVIPKGKQVEWR